MTAEVNQMTPEEVAARKKRNVWLALALVAFVVLVGVTSVIRISSSDFGKSDGLYFSGSLEKKSQPPPPELPSDE